MATFAPTDEQAHVVELFSTGDTLAVNAYAGTGKTSTLQLVAEAAGRRGGQYVAFNKAIVTEAGRKFPRTVACNTAHSLAFRAVGRNMAHRLNARRMKGLEIAHMLGVRPFTCQPEPGVNKTLAAGYLAGVVMRTVSRFCQSAEPEPLPRHVPYQDGIDRPAAGRRTWDNNYLLREHIMPWVREAWRDLMDPEGRLPYKHEHYLKCQPPGTMVRLASGMEKPIEEVQAGDQVVTWDGSVQRLRRALRTAGRSVTRVGSRPYAGPMVTAWSPDGLASRYTADHICVAWLDELSDGNHVVYLMRRGNQYRVGRTPWRMGSQSNRLGPVHRSHVQGADAMWVLSAHPTDREAALAEALAQYQYGIPGWQWRSRNEFMPLGAFWSEVGDNTEAARRCLRAHGRMIEYPLWENDGRHRHQRRPIEIRACNLMNGMKLCVVDPDGTDRWVPGRYVQNFYSGPVYSLDVETDHTYVADGIVTHNCWQLGDPFIPADYIMFDEAQDANPVMLAIVANQHHAQRVYVGDAYQQIYTFTGAVNALQSLGDEVATAALTQSFRFGPAIADLANTALGDLGAPAPLVGFDQVASTVGPIDQADAVLTRTNARAMTELFAAIRAGRRPHLVGGGSEVARFARAAEELQTEGRTGFPDLACFESWGEVQEYVAEDPQGSELALMVKLVDEFTTSTILEALDRMPSEAAAGLVISTAHKAKGREWHRVQLGNDFPDPVRDARAAGALGDPDAASEELRLLYVAVTRGQHHVDASAVPYFDTEPETDPILAGPAR